MEERAREEVLAMLHRRIGQETEPTVTEVHAGMIRKFSLATGEIDPVHLDAGFAATTRYGGIIAPATFVAAFTSGHFPEIVSHEVPGFPTRLHSRDIVDIRRPIRSGDTITAFARYAAAEIREGRRGWRLYQSADLILRDAAGELVANVRIVVASF